MLHKNIHTFRQNNHTECSIFDPLKWFWKLAADHILTCDKEGDCIRVYRTVSGIPKLQPCTSMVKLDLIMPLIIYLYCLILKLTRQPLDIIKSLSSMYTCLETKCYFGFQLEIKIKLLEFSVTKSRTKRDCCTSCTELKHKSIERLKTQPNRQKWQL